MTSSSTVVEVLLGLRRADGGDEVRGGELVALLGPKTTAVRAGPPVDALLAWTVREGVTNLIRHSHATTCTLRLRTDPRTAAVEVTDDGVGPAEAAPGSGLAPEPLMV